MSKFLTFPDMIPTTESTEPRCRAHGCLCSNPDTCRFNVPKARPGKHFYVAQYGYTYPNPEPMTLKDAERTLVAEAKKSLKSAKRRGHKGATYHRVSPECVRVTLGKDRESTLWAHFSILFY